MKQNTLVYLIGFIAVLFLIARGSTDLGLSEGVATDLIEILPGLLVCFFALRGYHDSRGPLRSLAFFMFGIGVALFAATAYNMGIVPDTMLDGLTIAELQTWVIIFGGVLSSVDYYRR